MNNLTGPPLLVTESKGHFWKKTFKMAVLSILFVLCCSISLFLFYSNSLKKVNERTLGYYAQLKIKLEESGFKARLLVISGKRAEWHNQLLTSFGAARNSQHLHGNAIDIIVLDVNNDEVIDEKDVDVVSGLLETIIKDEGGIGTYKNEKLIWNRQMVHFDCRGYKARWKR